MPHYWQKILEKYAYIVFEKKKFWKKLINIYAYKFFFIYMYILN